MSSMTLPSSHSLNSDDSTEPWSDGVFFALFYTVLKDILKLSIQRLIYFMT